MSDLDQPAVSRGLLIALAVVVVLALGWVAFSALTGGDDEDVAVAPVPRPDTPDVVLPGEAVPDVGGDPLYEETTEVFAARDPFSQLVVERPPGSTPILDGAQPGGTPTGGQTPGGTGGDGSGDGGSGDGGSGDGGSGDGSGEGDDRPPSGSEAEVGGTRVKLVDVYEQDGEERALVTVNGRSYDVVEGERFADRFRLLDLTGECGTFLFGDSRFVLCEGDEIRK